MYKIVLTFIAAAALAVFLLCAKQNTLYDPSGAEPTRSFARLCDTLIENPTLADTAHLVKRDTIHTGDSIAFVGIVTPANANLRSVKWDFGDGKDTSAALAIHRYSKGGKYAGVFTIVDKVGLTLSDTVTVCVNTPPDSMKLIAPMNGQTGIDPTSGQNLFLKWSCRDLDGDSLAYRIYFNHSRTFAGPVGATHNTTLNVFDVEKLDTLTTYYWMVKAFDKYGDSAVSDTFSFRTKNPNATTGDVEGHVYRQGFSGGTGNSGIRVAEIISGNERGHTFANDSGYYDLVNITPGTIQLIFSDSTFFKPDTISVSILVGDIIMAKSDTLYDKYPPVITRKPDDTIRVNTGDSIFFSARDTFYSVDSICIDTGTGFHKTSQTSLTMNYVGPGNYVVRLKAYDPHGNIAKDSIKIHVNFPPAISTLSNPTSFSEVLINQPVPFSWTCTDQDNLSAVRYDVFVAMTRIMAESDIKGSTISGNSFSTWNPGNIQGIYYWKVAAFDGYDTTASVIDSFRVTNQSGSLKGSTFRQGKAGSAGNAGITVSALKAGIVQATTTTNDSGAFAFSALNGTLIVKSTNFGFAPESVSVVIVNGISNTAASVTLRDTFPPVITRTPDDTVKANADVSLSFAARDTFYSVDSVCIDTGTGFHKTSQTSLTMRYAVPGNYVVRLKAYDPHGNIAKDSIKVHVNFSPTIPTLSNPVSYTEVLVNQPVPFNWTCTDQDNMSAVRYNVYVGTGKPLAASDVKAAGVSSTSFSTWNPGNLQGAWYWKVMAFDGYDTATSAIDSFRVTNQSGSLKASVFRQGKANAAGNGGISITANRLGVVLATVATNDSGVYSFPALNGTVLIKCADYGFAPDSVMVTIANGIANTSPSVTLRDTLAPVITRTRDTTIKANTNLPIHFSARDTFYSVDSVLVDFGSGFHKTTITDTIVRYSAPGDYFVRVKGYDPHGNVGRDSVRIHINFPPSLVVPVQPISGAEVGTNTTPAFTWNAADPDNQLQLKYGIFIGTGAVLGPSDLKNFDITGQSYTQWNSGTVQQKYYWKVMAYDGYDTLTSRVDSLKVVDNSLTTGKCAGYARLQGVGHHSGIKILFQIQGGTNSYTMSTGDNGYYYLGAAFPGTYNVTVADTLRNAFQSASRTATIVIRDSLFLDTMVLFDTHKPVIAMSYPAAEGDTLKNLTTRSPVFTGTLSDIGSQIRQDSVKILFNGVAVTNATVTQSSWSFAPNTIADGHYQIIVNAKDSAGNAADQVVRDFLVNSKTISVSVNQSHVSIKDTMTFSASFGNVNPPIKVYYWNFNGQSKSTWDDSMVASANSAAVKWASPDSVAQGRVIVKVVDDSGIANYDSVNYTVYKDVPVPNAGPDTPVTINSSVSFHGSATQQFGTIVMYKWDFDGNGSYDDSSTTTGIATHTYTHETIYDAKLLVRDDDGNEATAIRHVTVQNQAPVITAIHPNDTISIKDSVQFFATARDVDGTIKEYAWDFNGDTTFEYKSATTASAGFRYDTARTYSAVLRVTDDDNKITKDTVLIRVLQDIPVPNAGADTTVSIKDIVLLHGSATQKFGTITEWAWQIGNSGTFTVTSKGDTNIIAPATENLTYLCILRVTDDDGNVAMDTVKVTVKQDVPKANAGSDTTLLVTDTIRLHGTATQDFGNITKWEWNIGGSGAFVSTSNSDTAFVKPQVEDSNFVCILRVTDDDGNVSAPDTVKILRLTHFVKWEFAAGNAVTASPAIGTDGTIYMGSGDHKVYAVNPGGIKKWDFLTGSEVSSSPTVGADGTIYGGNDGTKLYALNPDGTKKWEFATLGGFSSSSSPAVGADGTIYVGIYDSKIYAVNSDGTKKWEFATGGQVYSSPAVGTDGIIYVGSSDSKLYALNSDGTKKWEFAAGYQIESSPGIGVDGTIYVGCGDGKLYAVNPDGTKKWEFATANDINSSPAIGLDGTVYVGSDDSKLYAVNPDGTKKWEFFAGFPILNSSPAVGLDGTIYVGSDDSKLYAVNPDGSKKWEFAASGVIRSGPAIGTDGTVYIGSFDGKLYAIATTSKGLAQSAWPMFHHDVKHTGRAQ